MKNKPIDVHNHLMTRLERLCDEDLGGEELDEEIRRSKAAVDVAGAIVDNQRLVLDAATLAFKSGIDLERPDLPMLADQRKIANGGVC